MKLLTQYNRINLVTAVLILLVTGIVYYGAISFILNRQVDKDIKIEEQEVFSYINANKKLPPTIDYKDQKVVFYDVPTPVKHHFTDTGFYNKKEHDYEAGRALVTSALVGGVNRKIVIMESKVETEDLIKIIFYITIGVILFLLLVLFIVNRFFLNRLWQPFYNILGQLKGFSLSGNKEIEGIPSHIDEFAELNSAVTAMASRVKSDYKDLKNFTENASHELLTPIAVINSKLDSLVQTGDYNEIQSKLLTDVYDAVTRLTRLNQSLLLLVKIENRLLTDEQDIDLKPLIEGKLSELKELFYDKGLELNTSLNNKHIKASTYLIDILLNNLLSNAIRHSHVDSRVVVELGADKLMISNTGDGSALLNDEIFKRFNKSSNSEGTGLGLTISKQICDNYGYNLSYIYSNGLHIFSVIFNN
jgi:signal transduction histidine kinase